MTKAKVWTLDDGSQWTVKQLAQEAGVHKRTMQTRLHRSRRRAYVLAPREGDEGADGFAVCLRDNNAPSGYWFVGAYNDRKVAEKLASAQGKSGLVRPFRFTDRD